jgi:chromate transporter
MNNPDVLGQLSLVFLKMSLIAIGGSNAALTAYQYEVVDHYHWMTNETFAQLFATAQLAPGPNVTVVTLIGWQVAGLLGAIVATLSMLIPACLLAFIVGRVSSRFIDTAQYRVAQAALVPLAIGLLLSSGLNLAAIHVANWLALSIVAGCAAFVFYIKANPIWAILLGALAASLASIAGVV